MTEAQREYQRRYRATHQAEKKLYRKLYYQKHAAEIREKSRKWRLENKERLKEINRRWREANPERAHRYKLPSKYGITSEEYDALLERHSGCAICGKPCPIRRRLAIDHDHKTGKVRGLLCQPHNQAIGLFGDDPALMRKAAEYLEGR